MEIKQSELPRRCEETVCYNKGGIHRKRKCKVTEREEEVDSSFSISPPPTSCLLVVKTTSYPGAGAGLLPLEAAGKSGRGGPQGPGLFYS